MKSVAKNVFVHLWVDNFQMMWLLTGCPIKCIGLMLRGQELR